ncbi:hypothetical protein AB0I77_45675 [Streptomyces sp. NPDC050619]|uniref:hypothetical protein n=1 Tax=Streptomyces sp. NPDC050619 TaxID=3157214 RepID=UPI00342C1173
MADEQERFAAIATPPEDRARRPANRGPMPGRPTGRTSDHAAGEGRSALVSRTWRPATS